MPQGTFLGFFDLPKRRAPWQVASRVQDRWRGHAWGRNHDVFCGVPACIVSHAIPYVMVRLDQHVGDSALLGLVTSRQAGSASHLRHRLACGQLARAGWFVHTGRVTALHPQHRLSHGVGCQHYWSRARMDRSRQLGPALHLQH